MKYVWFSITDVRKLAFEIAERNQLKHRFNKNEKMAGKKWKINK
jgi:hypothetical protein